MRLERWLGALQERNFRVYFLGQSASAIGTGMAPVALSFAVLALPRANASDVGVVVMAGTIPLVVFLLVGGVVADRLGRRFVMFSADILRGAAEATLALWILLGHPPLWGFIVLSALVGTGTAFFMPASTALVREVVTDAHLSQANALTGLSSSFGGIVGPAAAGVIVAAASPGWAVMADAISYVVSVGSLVVLRMQPQPPQPAETFLSQLRAGWSEFWSRTWLWTIVLGAAVANMMLAPYFVLGPVIAKHSLGGAPVWGVILGANGAGSVLAGIALLRFQPKRPLVVGLLTLLAVPVSMLALGYELPVVVIAIGGFLAGASFAIFGTLWNTVMQREIPSEVLARVSAYDWLFSLVLLPIGFAIVGPISSAVGIRATFLYPSLYLVVSSLLTLAVPAVRAMQAPVRGPSEMTASPG